MSDEHWLRLWRVPGVGPTAFNKLLERFGTPEAALAASESAWREAGLKGGQVAPFSTRNTNIDADLEWLEAPDNDVLRIDSPRYPERLRQIPTPPPLLFLRGDHTLLDYPQLAIVGSRHPSSAGTANARAFSRHLATAGLGITSGLAMGIDSAAHEGALEANGVTIAVAGTGLDRIYPSRNRKLAHQIAASGLLVSEFPIGASAQASHFPRRNRIISGLSLGTLVVEAAIKSGSLITARYANEHGREVFAIPGSIHNPAARGCHQLIKQGAKLVETAEDILEELGSLLDSSRIMASNQNVNGTSSPVSTDPDHENLLRFIDYEPTAIDSIISRSGLTADVVSSMLLIMELNNLVAAEAGGYYVRLG